VNQIRLPLRLPRLCLAGAAVLAAYLLCVSISLGVVAGCGPGSGCDHVLRSPWAYCFGIPVSALALILYLSMLAGSFLVTMRGPGSRTMLFWLGLLAGAAVIVGAAAWFVFLQLFVLKKICKYCILTHGFATLGAVFLVLRAPFFVGASSVSSGAKASRPTLQIMAAIGTGLMAAVALAAVQQFFPHRMNLVRTYLGRFAINTRDLPLVGAPDVPLRIISLFDYTCPHCRLMHHGLARAQAGLQGRFAIISLPVPLDSKCNHLIPHTLELHQRACEFARLGLAVWRADPAVFAKFQAWFFDPDQTPAFEAAKQYAAHLLGSARLAQAMADPWVDQIIQLDVGVYEQSCGFAHSTMLPQIIVGSAVSVGPIYSFEDLLALLKTNLPLPK